MSIRDDLLYELDQLNGAAGWAAVRAVGPSGVADVRIEVASIETLGCEVASLVVSSAALVTADVDTLKAWSKRLAERVSYLLESLTPLEVDEENGELLMRSAQPQAMPRGRQYYELLLSAAGTDSVRFARYESTKGVPGRDRVDMVLTRDVVGRLVEDLVLTMP